MAGVFTASDNTNATSAFPEVSLPEPFALLNRRAWTLRRQSIVLALAAIFTALILQGSLRHGRLMLYPQPDDVTYLTDGIGRVRVIQDRGLPGFVADWAAKPPHSPFSTVAATSAFLLFGPQTWAPYVANVSIVVLILLVIAAIVRVYDPRPSLALYVFALTFPIAGVAIHEFRPDVACGVVVAAAMMCSSVTAARDLSRREAVVLGGIAGLAIWIKPTFIGYSLVLICLAIFAAAALRGFKALRNSILSCTVVGVTALVLAMPHIILAMTSPVDGGWPTRIGPGLKEGSLLGYILHNLVGEHRGLWRIDTGWLDHARYFLDGQGGSMMLGRHLWLSAALIPAGFLVAALRRRRATLRSYASLAFSLAVAYAIPTVNTVKNGFSASVFVVLLLFATVFSLVVIAAEARHRPLLRHVMPAALIAGLCLFQYRWEWGAWNPSITLRNQLVERTYGMVKEGALAFRRTSPDRNFHILLTTFGHSHNSATISFLALRDGISNIVVHDLHRTADLALYQQALDQADLVVANDVNSEEAMLFLPSTRIAARTLALARSQPSLALTDRFVLLGGSEYLYFKRVGRL